MEDSTDLEGRLASVHSVDASGGMGEAEEELRENWECPVRKNIFIWIISPLVPSKHLSF